MSETTKPKILLITETHPFGDDEERNQDAFNNLIETFIQNYEFDINAKSFDINYDYDINADSLMSKIDESSKELLFDDYLCVIAEGLSSWFWLRSKYHIPIICLNPVVDIKQLEDFCTVSTYHSFFNLNKQRAYSKYEVLTICVLSDDITSDTYEYSTEAFNSSNVYISKYDLQSEEFWKDENGIIGALKYAVENFSES